MKLRIHDTCWTASGGSYCAIYEADVKILRDSRDVRVEVVTVEPEYSAESSQKGEVVEAIRRGAENVLAPRNLGAAIRVQRLVIHPVDCKPHRFEEPTSKELQRLLDQPEEAGEP
jgi:hypothetical protein